MLRWFFAACGLAMLSAGASSGADDAPATPPASPAPDSGKKAETPVPTSPLVGLWIQQDSGGVLDIRENGRIEGFPVRGTWRMGTKPATVKIFSGGNEVLDCEWEVKSPDSIALTRQVEGQSDTVMLFRL